VAAVSKEAMVRSRWERGMLEHLLFSEVTEETRGPMIYFDCPGCRQQRAKGIPYERMTRVWFLHVFPIVPANLATKETSITCLQCGVLLGAELKLADLVGKTPEELIGRIYFRTTFLQKALAVIALFVAIFPMVGFVMSLIAVVANWQTRTWPKRISVIALVLSIPLMLFLGIGLALEAMGVI
jgi:hypothetical protein